MTIVYRRYRFTIQRQIAVERDSLEVGVAASDNDDENDHNDDKNYTDCMLVDCAFSLCSFTARYFLINAFQSCLVDSSALRNMKCDADSNDDNVYGLSVDNSSQPLLYEFALLAPSSN